MCLCMQPWGILIFRPLHVLYRRISNPWPFWTLHLSQTITPLLYLWLFGTRPPPTETYGENNTALSPAVWRRLWKSEQRSCENQRWVTLKLPIESEMFHSMKMNTHNVSRQTSADAWCHSSMPLLWSNHVGQKRDCITCREKHWVRCYVSELFYHKKPRTAYF